MPLRFKDGSLAQARPVDMPSMWSVWKGMQPMKRELSQLEREVINTAKRWCAAILDGPHAQIAADNELREAVENLEECEREKPATTSA